VIVKLSITQDGRELETVTADDTELKANYSLVYQACCQMQPGSRKTVSVADGRKLKINRLS
jgi:hypothetical protein